MDQAVPKTVVPTQGKVLITNCYYHRPVPFQTAKLIQVSTAKTQLMYSVAVRDSRSGISPFLLR